MTDFSNYLFSSMDQGDNDRVSTSIDAGLSAALYASLQRPLSGACQFANELAGRKLLSEPKVAAPPLEMPFGSPEWTAQQAGYGVGYAIDVGLLCAASRLKPFRAAGGYATAALERPYLRVLNTKGAQMFAAGFAMEGLLQPVHADEMETFWNARLRNAVNGGVVLSSVSLARSGAERLSARNTTFERFDSALWKMPSTLAGAAGAGLLAAETQTLFSNQRLANLSELKQSAVSYMVSAPLGRMVSRQPQIVMPQVEKTGINLSSETRKLQQLTDQFGITESAEPLISAFEERRRLSGLTEQEAARTLRQINRILGQTASVDSAITPELRKQLGLEVLHHAAYPTAIDQGRNLTCIVAASEGSMFSRAPSGPARMIAGLALHGAFHTHDGNTIRVPQSEIAPDGEAKNFAFADIGNGQRTWASQLYQVGTGNAYWQRLHGQYANRLIARGDLQYRIKPANEGERNDERISVIDSNGGETRLEEGSGPGMSDQRILQMERLITGKYMASRVLTAYPLDRQDRAILHCDSVDALRERLASAKRNGDFPLMVNVNSRSGRLWQAQVGETPIMLTDEKLGILSHSMQIQDYCPETGLIVGDNSWGNKSDFTGKANELRKLSVEELYDLMQILPKKAEVIHLSGNKKIDDATFSTRTPHFTELRQAFVSNTNLSDTAFVGLRSLERLELLDASRTRISDASAVTVGNLSSLVHLSLAGTSVTNVTAENIARLDRLKELELSNTNISNDGVKKLSAMKAVKALGLSGCDITDEALDSLASLKTLEKLNIVCKGLSPEAIRKMANQLPDLKDLTVNIDTFDSQTMIDWDKKVPAKCKTLFKSVHDDSVIRVTACTAAGSAFLVGGTGSGTINLRFTDNFKSTKVLELIQCKLEKEGMERLTSLNEMRRLVLNSTQLPPDALKGISTMRNLESLFIIDTQVSDADMAHLVALPKLQNLVVHTVDLTDKAIDTITALPKLQGLELRGTKISAEGVKRLKNIPALKQLILPRETVSPALEAELTTALPGCKLTIVEP